MNIRKKPFLALGLLSAAIISISPSKANEKIIAITDDRAAALENGFITSSDSEDDVIEMRTDRPLIVKLDREASNVIIGNDNFINIYPDSRTTLILMPLIPGATFFRAIDSNGDTIIEKRVIVAAPKQNYISVNRACGAEDELCEFQSIYYCPDMCHTVYSYSNNERINENEQIRNQNDEGGTNGDGNGDVPPALPDETEN